MHVYTTFALFYLASCDFQSVATQDAAFRSYGYKSNDTNHQLASVRHARRAAFDFDRSSHCRTGGQDVECTPPFQNIAQGARVHVTSTCGQSKVQRICRYDGTCQICDSNSNRWHFSASHLTDPHTSYNGTCWYSALTRAGGMENAVNLTLSFGKRFEVFHISLQPCTIGSLPDSIGLYKSSDFGQTWRPWHYFSTDCYRAFGLPTTNEHNTHITTANLQEVLCVALQSPDNYRHKQLRRRRAMYVQSRNRRASSDELVDSSAFTSDSVISFSTILGRPATKPWSPALIDWMTMTDIRIGLLRFSRPNSFDSRSKRTVRQGLVDSPMASEWSPYEWSHHNLRNTRPTYPTFNGYNKKRSPLKPRTSNLNFADLRIPLLNETVPLMYHQVNASVLTNTANAQSIFRVGMESTVTPEPDVLSESEIFAFSNLIIGGWCKCNGHAKECVLGADRKLRCVCEHNTEGVDCERCKSGFMDKPWERATTHKANSCTQCDCNLHSNECRFSNALYLMSNRVSGGVCENCQHNTAGRNCQHCAEGFYRDWTKPNSHEHVCIPCRCHPIGSVIRHDCDRRSGQCRCKQGVTGPTCDRCQDGYHQTRSPTNPCTKDYLHHAVAMAHTSIDIHCNFCDTNKERMRLKKFCRKDAVFQANFKSRELHGTMARFEMYVQHVWRISKNAMQKPNSPFWPVRLNYEQASDLTNEEEIRLDANEQSQIVPVWVQLNQLRCKCPEVELGISYLIVTDIEAFMHKGRSELLLTAKTALLPWRSSWRRRLARFQRRQNRGTCDRFRDMAKLDETNQLEHQPKSNPQAWHRTPRDSENHLMNNHRLSNRSTMRTAHRLSNIYNHYWSY